MSIIVNLIFGAIAGWIADLIMNRDHDLILNIVLGLIGSMVGSWIATRIFEAPGVNGFNLRSLAIAVLGAVLVIWIGSLF